MMTMKRALSRAAVASAKKKCAFGGNVGQARAASVLGQTGMTRQAAQEQMTMMEDGSSTDDPQPFYAQEAGPPKTTVTFRTADTPGALEGALRLFWKRDINMTRIESLPCQDSSQAYKFIVDVEGKEEEDSIQSLLKDLRQSVMHVRVTEPTITPWFPCSLEDLDQCVVKTLDAGAELDADHPGFKDETYRARRREIADWAYSFKASDPIPHINYTDTEVSTWTHVFENLQQLSSKHACKEYNKVMPLMKEHCGCRADNIPQVRDISQFLQETTGWRMRPVAGLLSARNFLNALAFKTFMSTQYIRHHSRPLYTPEPDICHELLGHAPMFADPDFAEFSHQIGLSSLGASDADIERLATCYWFSVEFGLCKERGEMKAYGAGLLSSFGEMEYACSTTRPAGGVDHMPEYKLWEPEKAAQQEYPITTYQPIYYVANSLRQAKESMIDFCNNHIKKPFHVRYDHDRSCIRVDRSVMVTPPPVEDPHPYA
eukprot:g1741.t1